MGKQKSGAKKKEGKAKEDDDETIQQVREVQDRLEELNYQADQCKASINRCELDMRRCNLTIKELEPLPDDTKMYRQVGKMFLLQPKQDLTTHLQGSAALKSVEAQQLKQALAKLGDQAQSEANSLKELLGPEKFKSVFPGLEKQQAAAAGK
mmetsp:Transcript_62636/g.181568  ORF Transcript_62636/g.181568 Transcript_62636/m.181568 type:complete len:152 (+) Transcript_62636:100-555(+)